jgi:hypothetical protein
MRPYVPQGGNAMPALAENNVNPFSSFEVVPIPQADKPDF